MPHTFTRFPERHTRRRAKDAMRGDAVTVNAARAPGPSARLYCRCGQVALRHVGKRGYCGAHTQEAWRAAKREAGHASETALMNWITNMNLEEGE